MGSGLYQELSWHLLGETEKDHEHLSHYSQHQIRDSK